MPEENDVPQLDLLTPQPLLSEARADVEARLPEGSVCPCCHQLARLYRRKLNSNMVVFLLSLVQRSEDSLDGWVHYKECSYTGRDYSHLRAWGLAAMRERLPDDSSRRVSGLWKPTEKGILFARGLVNVPTRVHLYNNVVRGFSADQVSVREALGDHFNYDDLWEGR